MRITNLTTDTKKDILNNLLKRSPNNYLEYEEIVNEITDNVRRNGDRAVFDYTLKFDKFALDADNIRVTEEEIQSSCGTAGLTPGKMARSWA